MTSQSAPAEPIFYYEDHYAYLFDELRKLDLLIEERVIRFRAATNRAPRAVVTEPLHISHAQVDWLLAGNEVHTATQAASDDTERALATIAVERQVLQERIDGGVAESINQGIYLPLTHLTHLFRLSPFEQAALIICLAPELRRKYDTLYAYLQDDITRKKPSVDLILELLCTTEADRWQARAVFGPQAPLQRAQLLQMVDDPQSPSGSTGLAQFLRLDPRILGFLLGHGTLDERLRNLATLQSASIPLADVPVAQETKTAVANLVQHTFSQTGAQRLVCHLYGPRGVGRREFALGVCDEIGASLLVVDIQALLARGADAVDLLRLAFREGLLCQAAFYVDHVDRLIGAETSGDLPVSHLRTLLVDLHNEYGWLTFLAGERAWLWQQEFTGQAVYAVHLPVPDPSIQETVWRQSLGELGAEHVDSWARQLANQFRMTPQQIRHAVDYATHKRIVTEGQADVTLADLYAGCRHQANVNLGELATKVDYKYGWADLVLPESKLTQLREICAQVRHRNRVFAEWGFSEKLGHGRGLSVLFCGPPGTGKTLAAAVLAGELGLDLCKVDLSGVVSKYIGETEKNLAKIFHEAESSNAILFFDEADALFGKRTEVSDARDRYANIETSYLLQKMEEYEGIVILATNLRENMDEAFTRRIRFIVDFPFPDAASRSEIWRTHFPDAAPVDEGVDVDALARQLQVTGGNIKNIVLNAAFSAAENGQVIDMAHLLHGAQREFEKIGKIWEQSHL